MADTAPAFDLTGFLPYRLAVLAERLSVGLARQYRSEFGISIPEWRVLAHLFHSGSVSVRDIEKYASLEKSKASRAASRLQSAGYITKVVSASDRRLLELALTDKGRTLMAQLIPRATAYQEHLLARLGENKAGLEAAIDSLMED